MGALSNLSVPLETVTKALIDSMLNLELVHRQRLCDRLSMNILRRMGGRITGSDRAVSSYNLFCALLLISQSTCCQMTRCVT